MLFSAFVWICFNKDYIKKIKKESSLNQIKTNARNGTENGEKSDIKKNKVTTTECHKKCQLTVARNQKLTSINVRISKVLN